MSHPLHRAGFKPAQINYEALGHLKWAYRRQPERAPEVWRAVRDLFDRLGLSPVLTGPVPTLCAVANSFPTIAGEELAATHKQLLLDWWELHTAVYHLLVKAVV